MRIKREKVSSLVLEELKKMIKSGEFPYNSKLPSETELAKMFGVSRSPVREALSVLAASGLIESTQGGGSWVREVNLAEMLEHVQFEMVKVQQVQDLLEMRTIIESEAAFLAAKRYKPQDIVDLEEALEAFRKASEDQFKIGYEEDYAFHRIIVRAAYNPFLTQTMENVSELHVKSLMFSLEKNLGWEEKRKEVFTEHVNIFNAIKNGDGIAARTAVIEHLTNTRIKLGDKRVSKQK
ncbi:FadR/GntR family transcriptional regulator [Robertmurraya kyonggiensis]|uniref:FadR family transcriptional regulator n=1 Tax=Robertmurraya kyonggiensis TaxID=1037680 RepID=A0A4U1D9B3_9BACI|nr:FadR/GntR family transcriptional regulator [Robertmurraya kyonggiensis]TKC18097.1 FadR family transcriptional regulator [Robertmurraya kyonggiensis]